MTDRPVPTDAATAWVAEIKQRHVPGYGLTLAHLIQTAKTRHPHADGDVIVMGCVVTDAARLRTAVRQAWFRDLPALLAAAERVLAVADQVEAHAARLRQDTQGSDGPAAFLVERNDRAAELLHVAEDIRAACAPGEVPHGRG